MRIASGKVVGGRVELDSELPEGARVTVLATEGNETFDADPEIEKVLLEAIAQCERGETITRLPDSPKSPASAKPPLGREAHHKRNHPPGRSHRMPRDGGRWRRDGAADELFECAGALRRDVDAVM